MMPFQFSTRKRFAVYLYTHSMHCVSVMSGRPVVTKVLPERLKIEIVLDCSLGRPN